MNNADDEIEASIQPPLRGTWKQRLLRSVIALVIGYAAICIGLVCMETRLVFPGAYLDAAPVANADQPDPDQPIDGPVTNGPVTNGPVTTLAYRAVDGQELRGRIEVREQPDRVILFLHGNRIRAVDLDPWTRRLADVANATVLTAEYRGFQADGFTPTEASTIADAVSAIDALSEVTGVSPENITIYGRSLGGGVGAGLVAAMRERGAPPKSLILDRTFDSTMHIGADRYYWLPVRYLMRNQFDSSARLRDFSGNVVQTHGPPDRVVPMKNGRALFDSLITPHKIWIEVPGLHHNDRMSDETLRHEFESLQQLEQLDRETRRPTEAVTESMREQVRAHPTEASDG